MSITNYESPVKTLALRKQLRLLHGIYQSICAHTPHDIKVLTKSRTPSAAKITTKWPFRRFSLLTG